MGPMGPIQATGIDDLIDLDVMLDDTGTES